MSLPELNITVQECLKRLRCWRVPPHWSYADWQDEVAAQAQSAAWEAFGDYDVSRGVPLNAFVHLRVITRVLTRYRQEWTYAMHCAGGASNIECDGATEDSRTCLEDYRGFTEVYESLRDALLLLPQADRWLIEQLFWGGCTETEIARLCGVTQPAISKRKRAVLQNLRKWLEVAEKY